MDDWTERLSEYIDGELTAEQSAGLEAHLSGCGECRAVLAELSSVVGAAGSLRDETPTSDLWTGVAARIGERKVAVIEPRPTVRERIIRFSLPQLAAAAIALIVVSGGIGAVIAGGGGSTMTAISAPNASPGTGIYQAGQTEIDFQSAINELEAALQQGSEVLDPETVTVLEESLHTIDAAILEARRALAADPGNDYLNGYLARTMRTKLSVLERGNDMIISARL